MNNIREFLWTLGLKVKIKPTGNRLHDFLNGSISFDEYEQQSWDMRMLKVNSSKVCDIKTLEGI